MEISKKSVLLTAAMTGLLTVTACSTPSKSVSADTVGMCYGVNACKAQGDCAGKVEGCDGKNGCESVSSCAGKNSCKGKGFKKLSKKECDAKNGKFQS